MALIKEYFELTEKYQNEYGENTILLMQVGSFMECYGLMDKNTNNISGSNPRTILGIVVVAVLRMLVPNCSEATVTNIAQ